MQEIQFLLPPAVPRQVHGTRLCTE